MSSNVTDIDKRIMRVGSLGWVRVVVLGRRYRLWCGGRSTSY